MVSDERYYISGNLISYYPADIKQWPLGLFITRFKVGSWKSVLTLGVL